MKDFIPYNHYVHQHDEKINAEYADRRTDDIADEVQRNYYSVSRKAKTLGVQKMEAFMLSSGLKGSKIVAHGLAQQYSMKKTHEQKAQSQRERRRKTV